MKEIMKCGQCDKELTVGMEIEHSQHCNEYFCNPDCATQYYYEYMVSSCLDMTNLEDSGIIIKKNRLYK